VLPYLLGLARFPAWRVSLSARGGLVVGPLRVPLVALRTVALGLLIGLLVLNPQSQYVYPKHDVVADVELPNLRGDVVAMFFSGLVIISIALAAPAETTCVSNIGLNTLSCYVLHGPVIRLLCYSFTWMWLCGCRPSLAFDTQLLLLAATVQVLCSWPISVILKPVAMLRQDKRWIAASKGASTKRSPHVAVSGNNLHESLLPC